MNKLDKTLYKLDSKGKLRTWSISAGTDSGVPFYSVKHGQDGGKLQETKVFVSEGKNVGRSNETTPVEQCLTEAYALYDKQIARKGYSEEIPTEVPNLPMLAHKYRDFAHKVKYPAIVVVKEDGVRLIITIKNKKVKCTSRTGKELVGLEHITNELLTLGKDIVLDGELYSHTLSFEETVSVVRKSKSTDPRMSEVFFYAFDIINGDTYHQRVVALDALVSGLNHTKIVPWFIVKSPEEIEDKHKQFVGAGEEGTMIRNMDSLYQPNKRSYDLLKLKEFLEEEFKVIGWSVGKGKFSNIPTFKLVTKDNKMFEAVPKGNEKIRLEYLQKANSYIGTKSTVRFFEYTEDKIPRFPIIIQMDRFDID